jgi:hypothetical protein
MEAFHKNDTYKSGRASTCVECRHVLDKILRQTEEYKARKLAYARTEKARAAKRRYHTWEFIVPMPKLDSSGRNFNGGGN